MKTDTAKTFAGVLAAALCLGQASPAGAFWTRGGKEKDAAEQLGIAIPERMPNGTFMKTLSEPAMAQATPAEDGATRIFSENDPWHRRLAEAVGVDYPCAVESKPLGGAVNAVTKLTFDDGRRRESVVVKNYATVITTAKFIPMKLMLPGTPIIMTPGKRLENDVTMIRKFKEAGFRAHDVVLTDPKHSLLVTRFVPDMISMDKFVASALQGDAASLGLIRRLGEAFGAIHSHNFTFGDSRAGNFMLVNGELWFTDLEQAAINGNKNWDLAEFFYFSITIDKPAATPEQWSVVAREFLQGYKAGGGQAENIKGAMNRGYFVNFVFSLPLACASQTSCVNQILAVRREMKAAAGTDEPLESL